MVDVHAHLLADILPILRYQVGLLKCTKNAFPKSEMLPKLENGQVRKYLHCIIASKKRTKHSKHEIKHQRLHAR
jgi:hypothetical protein